MSHHYLGAPAQDPVVGTGCPPGEIVPGPCQSRKDGPHETFDFLSYGPGR